MSNTLQPLLSTEHKDHGWKRSQQYSFAAQHAWAPLLLAELGAVLPFYALAFAALPQGGFALAVLQGLHDGENLFLDANGRWQAGYVPSAYRSYPFALAKVADDPQNRMLLCFDHTSKLYREAPNIALGEERFFDDEGKPSPFIAQVIQFLNATHTNRLLTHQAVQAIADAGILEPWVWPFASPDSARPLLQGFYRIKEAALNLLDAATLKGLQQANSLPIIYAQLLSTPRIANLRSLYEQKQPATQLEKNINSLFGGVDDDNLNIDWNAISFDSLDKG